MTEAWPREVRIEDARRAQEHKREFFWQALTALTFNGIDGDYAEFGVYVGGTFGIVRAELERRPGHGRHMWAFDSFAGLPASTDPRDEHVRWKAGTLAHDLASFRQRCEDDLGLGPDDYTAIPGFFDEVLPGLPAETAANLALVYVDCDMYSSTRAVLDFLRPRLKHGMIIGFDDYWCWSAERASGERLAMDELAAEVSQWRFVPWRDFGWAGRSFVVERFDAADDQASATRST
jgi:O-methyltransferase